MQPEIILIKGAGEMASAIAHRLARCYFKVIMTELPFPKVIRRGVSFAQAVFSQKIEVEGIAANLSTTKNFLFDLKKKNIVVIVDPQMQIMQIFKPLVFIDASMAKKNLGTRIDLAPLVIGLGPGFEAAKDVHYVIETNRGHHLGRIISNGCAMADTGVPGSILGFDKERVVRAPASGSFKPILKIGDIVKKNAKIGHINKEVVYSPIAGVVRGLIHQECLCTSGMKIGDVDPRAETGYCYQISDKARNIAGSVLEVIVRNCRKVNGTVS